MPQHPIVSRKYLRKGVPNWRVRVPDDLWQSPEIRHRNFLDEKDAIAFAKSLQSARKELASRFLKLSPLKQGEIMKRYEEENARVNVTVNAACEKCLASKTASGIRPNSRGALKCTLNSICRSFGGKRVGDVTADDLMTWLAENQAWSPKSRLNNFKYASSFFSFALKQKYRKDNPCTDCERPRVPFKGVSILPVADIKKLLSTCYQSDPALLGFIVLVLFGGLRVAESARCLPANVANGVIDLGGEQTKLNTRRCIKISAQLAAWLAVPGVEIGGKHLNQRMKLLKTVSGVAIPKNALRHSFCSYTYPLLGAAATARAANNSETMLSRHYLGLVADEDAKAFAEIMPETACQDAQTIVTSSPAI